MKKIALLILFFILVLVVGAPYLYGHLYKNIYYADIEAIKRSHPDIEIKVVSYHVGWLHSQAVMTVALPEDTFSNAALYYVTVNSAIQHGPLIKTDKGWQFAYADIQTVVYLPDAVKKHVPNLDGFIFVNSQLALNGTTMTSNFTIPSIVANNPPSKIIWAGLFGDLVSESKNSELVQAQGRLSIGNLYVKSPKSELWLEPIQYIMSAVMDASGLWSGSSSFKMDSLIVKSVSGALFSIKNVTNNADSGVANGTYNFKSELAIEQILSPSTTISSLSNVKFAYILKNINANGYANIDKRVLSESPPALAGIYVLMQTLTPATSVDLAISTNTNLGAASASLSLVFTQVPKTMLDLPNSVNFVLNKRFAQTLVNTLLIKYVVDQKTMAGSPISKEEASLKVKAFIDDLIQNNYLKQDDKDYFLTLKKVGKDIILNDQKIDVNAVSGHFMQNFKLLMANPASSAAPGAVNVLQ